MADAFQALAPLASALAGIFALVRIWSAVRSAVWA